MRQPLTFLDTAGIQHMTEDARLVCPRGHVTGSGQLTLWLRDAKSNRFWPYPYTFSEQALAEGLLARLLTIY